MWYINIQSNKGIIDEVTCCTYPDDNDIAVTLLGYSYYQALEILHEYDHQDPYSTYALQDNGTNVYSIIRV